MDGSLESGEETQKANEWKSICQYNGLCRNNFDNKQTAIISIEF